MSKDENGESCQHDKVIDNEDSEGMGSKIDRRGFIKSTVAGTVAAGLAFRGASAAAKIIGANDRIVVGLIGAGRMGQTNLYDFMQQPDVQVAAVCDVFAPNLDKTAEKAEKADRQQDYRRVLDRKDIDAVIVATPDHWHSPAMIMACQAGKDVYVEKPI